MRRMIVHDEPDHRMGGEVYYRKQDYMRDPELREAFECGVKEGWRQAMREVERENGYHERRDWRELPPMMREHDRDWRKPEDDEIAYRRRRDSRGRYM